MARRKRRYVPKVKGCHQCSQRRVDCDNTRPSCKKCASRGIECSGFGFRYRFVDGRVPKRDALPLSPSTVGESAWGVGDGLETLITPQLAQSSPQNGHAKVKEEAEHTFVLASEEALFPQLAEILAGESEISEAETALSKVQTARDHAWVDYCLLPLAAWKEHLLDYYSKKIAPEMVVLDDHHNGWRHLILPLAQSDDLIMNAVLCAAASHLTTTKRGPDGSDADRFYTKAITSLQKRQDLIDGDAEGKQLIVLALIVLLTAVIASGSSDFPIIFRLLESAIVAVGGENELEGGGELARFCLRQIRKMRIYAAPLLGPDEGVEAISHYSAQSFECLEFYKELYPECSDTFDTIAALRQCAFTIYLDRVLSAGRYTATAGLVGQFASVIESLPQGMLGEHILVWPVFIAASESEDTQHRRLFKQFLENQFRRNGFANLEKAIEVLEDIWARGRKEIWPLALPESKVFVM